MIRFIAEELLPLGIGEVARQASAYLDEEFILIQRKQQNLSASGGGEEADARAEDHLVHPIPVPDAGHLAAGGDLDQGGGFWGDAAIEYPIYLPLVLRNR